MLSKSASSFQWFLHPVIQRTSDPTIAHVFTYTLVSQIRIRNGVHIPVNLSPYISIYANLCLLVTFKVTVTQCFQYPFSYALDQFEFQSIVFC